MRRLMFVVGIVIASLMPLASVANAQSPKPAHPAKVKATKTVVGLVTPLNLNTATAAQLDLLPGIGKSTAQRIVDYRQKNGNFKKIEEILETSRSCPYSLNVFDFSPRPSVSGSRQKSQQISR